MEQSQENNYPLSIAYGKPLTGVFCEKENIGRLLIESANGNKDKGITFIQNDDSEIFLSYETILVKALDCLGGLQERGFKQGQFAMLLLEDNRDFVITYWACILGGIIPVPLSYPTSTHVQNTSLSKLGSVWHTLERPLIISDENLVGSRKKIESILGVQGLEVIDGSAILHSNEVGKIHLAPTDNPAFIQFSSGSTNIPKGVILTHQNLLTNIESMVRGTEMNETDRFLSWMPYHHDMGIIGFHLTPTAMGVNQFNMHPLKFVKRPTLWLDRVTEHKITFTGSPNFGYRLLLNRAKAANYKKWDLSSLRFIFNGAEPISVSLMDEFMDRLGECGLKKSMMFPVYGMAEACLGLCFPPIGSEPLVHSLHRPTLVSEGKMQATLEKDEQTMLLVDEGHPVPGVGIRVVDDQGYVVPEGTVGEIEISGNNVTSGYINNPEVTEKSIKDGWLKTGDTGYLLNGRITIAGRLKDIIFVNGQNYYAHDIEAVINQVEGVKPDKVAVCGWLDEKEGKEKIGLFSTLRTLEEETKPLYARIVSHVNEVMGIPIDYVIFTKSIPKTTSGKVQRFVLIEAFKRNEFADKILTSSDLMMETDDKEETTNRKKSAVKRGEYAEGIRDIWAKVLERPADAISFDQPFLSIGGTSIKAIQILGFLEEEFSLALTHDLLINCRTINEMDTYIVNLVQGNPSSINEVAASLQPKERKVGEGEEGVAVIAMSCRFPDAANPTEFWNNLIEGICSITDIPSDRWAIHDYYSPTPEFGKTYTKTGAFISNPYDFDADLFHVLEKEAAVMDPQQRIILELVFELMEQAGYSKEKFSGKKVGLFIGAGANSYYEYHLHTLSRLNLQRFASFNSLTQEQQDAILEEWKNKFGVTEVHPNILVDNLLNMIAARTSQEFNFKGPSMVVDTACSSSLVTLHTAYESLKRGECEVAIAGGIHLLLTPTPYLYFSHAGALSASGQSLVFDAQADGFVPGEGAGLVMLKPLKKAMADQDHILGVIKASGVNNDGHSIGVMAPNPDGQRDVIESLYDSHGIHPESIQYIEAHGTGTKIGDPSEIRAIDSAYKKWNIPNQSIAIGSVKANIGHLLSAAGISSFIKTIMALSHKKIPQNVNVATPNPMLRLDKTPFYLLSEPKDWAVEKGMPRRAAINSFGFGGTNCHLVVEEAPHIEKTEKEYSQQEPPKQVLCLSAHTQQALENKIRNLADYLEAHQEEHSLGDVCYTENVTRSSFINRHSVVASSIADLVEKLRKTSPVKRSLYPNKVALMFTGQGSQYVGMARELYELLPSFKKIMDACSDAFYPYLNQKITDLIYGEDADEQLLAQTHMTQPVIFTLDYAFGKLLMELGVEPACMLGHSVGEWVAACLSGVVSLQDAVRLVALRGKLMSEIQTSGGMAAIFTSKESIETLLQPFHDSLWVAGYNVTHQAISGDGAILDQFLRELEEKRIPFKRLKVSQAFHTPLLQPMIEPFRKELAATTFHTPKIPIVSNVTGEYINEPITADYWLEHILGAVKFEQSINYILDQGILILVEAGPDKTLAGMAGGIVSHPAKHIFHTLDRRKDAWDVFHGTIGELYSLGVGIHLERYMENYGYKKVALPSYPFTRKTFKPDFGEIHPYTNWFYEWNWQPEIYSEASELAQGAILVFDDKQGVGREIANAFHGERNPIYFVTAGEEFFYDGDKDFVINPKKPGDYSAMLNRIPNDLAAVLHLWNPAPESACSLFFMGKALISRNFKHVRLMILTNKAFSVTRDNEIDQPHQTIAAVIGQAIDQDQGELTTYILDVNQEEYASHKEDLAQIIANELNRKINEESIVAIRDGKRLVRTLVKTSLPAEGIERDWSDGETYLITGGTGHIGGEIAKAFATKAKIHLILTGRKDFPPERLVQALEEQGTTVEYYSVDVTDQEKMEEMIDQVNKKYGSIHGVVHAAGIVDPASFKLLGKEWDDIEKVLQPKVQGTLIVDKITRKEPLKFFVTLSSVSASKKAWAAGLGDYAAANAFLNSYSTYRGKSGAPGKSLSINFSLWQDKGLGSVFGDMTVLAVKAQKLQPLPSKEATQAFMRALNYEKQPVIHIFDHLEEGVQRRGTLANAVDAKPALPNQLNRTQSFKSSKEVRQIVYQVIADEIPVLVNDLEVGMNFLDLSIDSVKATKVIAEIGRRLNAELYPTLLFEYQTPEALAEYIEKTYTENGDGTQIVNMDTPLEESGTNQEDIQDIAIIGMSLRIPGAKNLEEYWDILEKGKCMIKEVPSDRWSKEKNYDLDPHKLHTTYSKHGGFIDQPYDFDPLFFGMSPKEAEVTDPQQRVFLEIAWEVLQQGGYGGKHRTNKIGVFVGTEQNTYMEHFMGYRSYMQIKESLENSDTFKNLSITDRNALLGNIADILDPGPLVADAIAGNGLNEVAGRVSHCLNLMGPSMIVNAACASSLVALHNACESIRNGQTDMAIAGGVNLNLTATPYVSLSKVTALSPTGNCYPFDKRANGMILSEGAGAVLLKPLQNALKDGDHIYAVIKGSAINNDGHSQGITAPRPQGQAEAIRKAYLNAGINPETVSYIETHGTGTPLGDPIEVEGMTQAFRSFTKKEGFCGMGSVKSSIGHMLSAAGIVSLMKVVLALNNKKIPHTIHYEEPNANINFGHSPFYVVDKEPKPWNSEDNQPLRAGVNAFGFGGTNAHIILEEAPKVLRGESEAKDKEESYLLCLTGRTENVVKTIASNLKTYVENHPDLDVSSICYSMNHAQKEMAQKYAVLIHSKEQLLNILSAIETGVEMAEIIQGRSNPNRQTSFHLLFDGNLKLDLEEIAKIKKRFPAFATAFEKCQEEINALLTNQDHSELDDRIVDFSMQYAYGSLLSNIGVKPSSIFCEGLGILVGSVLTGLISITQAGQFMFGEKLLEEELLQKGKDDFWDCPMITPLGMVDREHLKYVRLDDLKQMLQEDQIRGSIGKGEEILGVEMDKGMNPVDSILRVMAKLYTLGVNYHPAALFLGGGKHIPLPNYPFENKFYKVSFKDEHIQESKVDNKPVDGVKKRKDLEQLNRDLALLSGKVY